MNQSAKVMWDVQKKLYTAMPENQPENESYWNVPFESMPPLLMKTDFEIKKLSLELAIKFINDYHQSRGYQPDTLAEQFYKFFKS